jgi:hypothetical protein
MSDQKKILKRRWHGYAPNTVDFRKKTRHYGKSWGRPRAN